MGDPELIARLPKEQACFIIAVALISGGFTFGDLSHITGRSPRHVQNLASDPVTKKFVAEMQKDIAARVMAYRVSAIKENKYSNIPITDTIQQVIAAHTVREGRRQRRRPGQAPGQPAPGKRPGDGQVGAAGQDRQADPDLQDTQTEGGSAGT